MNLKTKKFRGLYVIIDPSFINSEDPVNVAKQVLDGGANIIQLRNKADNIRDTVDWAIKISRLCNTYNAFFIVNDRVDIAIISNSDGVHLGQGDISPDHVKNITDKDISGEHFFTKLIFTQKTVQGVVFAFVRCPDRFFPNQALLLGFLLAIEEESVRIDRATGSPRMSGQFPQDVGPVPPGCRHCD